MLQTMQGLHAEGRAHCDIKPANIRVEIDKDDKLVNLTLHDLGGSIAYTAGEFYPSCMQSI